ncbi:MAG TPA: tripartite tricarboxylate transporter substrate binding protein [Xanthobacteraceae bacterium]|jgi:tripartite-type tricarboxylate transporter receptor subunit TctC
MSFNRALIAGWLLFLAAPALAQAPAAPPFPGKQLHFVVPFPPGGTLDVLARTVSNELGPALGQTVVVENRPGASGVLGAEIVARAPADGHTLVIVSNTLVTLPAMRKDLPFDIFKDFAPVIELGSTPTVVTVHPSFPARNLEQLIELAKKAKGGVNYNSPGIASPPHLAGELLARAAHIPLVHVSYRGTQPAVTDLVAGHVPVMMAPLNAVLPFIRDQRLFPIAVTDAGRTRYLPDVPTLREAGLTNMPPVTSWFAVLTTSGTSAAVVSRLNAEIARVLHDPKVQERLESQTFEIKAGSPEELGALMRKDAATNAMIVAEANIKAE